MAMHNTVLYWLWLYPFLAETHGKNFRSFPLHLQRSWSPLPWSPACREQEWLENPAASFSGPSVLLWSRM